MSNWLSRLLVAAILLPVVLLVVYAGVWTDHGDIWIQLDDYSVVKA